MTIIARTREVQLLESTLSSKKPEFVAIYGRRRIGKTYLVREFFKQRISERKKDILYFECTGQKNAPISIQIDSFCYQLEQLMGINFKLSRPKTWIEALRLLHEYILSQPQKKIILFFDELPWFSGQKSLFIHSLDHAWNQFWSKDPRIKLIVCGSAASWMNDHIVNASGGLHNRTTRQILLSPFLFHEILDYAKHAGLRLDQVELLKLYMIFGGVPYYWQLMPKGKSAGQITEELIFRKDGPLRNEFQNLFRSLFQDYAKYETLVRLLASKVSGLTRNEIIEATGMSTGGALNRYLRNLELSGFIESFSPFGHIKKDSYFRLIDEFCLFHLYWIRDPGQFKQFWSQAQNSPQVKAWAGYAFENFCLHHKMEIAYALGIDKLVQSISSWRSVSKRKTSTPGVQIDLLFVRSDQAINMVEIKFSSKEYKLEKADAKSLQLKAEVFREKTNFKGQIFINLVTSAGHKKGLWDDEVLDATVDLKDFAKKTTIPS